MSYPRSQLSRNFKRVRYTGGNISLATTSVTAVHASALDIVLSAQVGDVIEYNVSGLLANVAQDVGFDVYTIVSAATVNPFGAGLSASLASTTGVSGWYAGVDANYHDLTGAATYVIQSGDISSSTVTLRLYFAKTTATARNLLANANQPLDVWAKNLGPPDPN